MRAKTTADRSRADLRYVGLLEPANRSGVMGDAAQLPEVSMFGWAIAFLVIAIIAGILGFGGVAGTAFSAAKIVFIVALIAFLISGVLGFSRRGMP